MTEVFISYWLSAGGHPQLPDATHIPCQVAPSILKPAMEGQILLCFESLFFPVSDL